jgi:hypothetical protein
MIKTSNSKCREYVDSLKPFKANNLEGKIQGDFYIVYSYSWYALFAYNFQTNQWYENIDKYSVSTSRQTTQARPYDRKIIDLSWEDMKDLLIFARSHKTG